MSWNDIPTCKEAGVPTDYTMLRGIFMAAGVTPTSSPSTSTCSRRSRATPEWKEYMEKGAFNPTFMTGDAFTKWLESAESDAPRR